MSVLNPNAEANLIRTMAGGRSWLLLVLTLIPCIKSLVSLYPFYLSSKFLSFSSPLHFVQMFKKCFILVLMRSTQNCGREALPPERPQPLIHASFYPTIYKIEPDLRVESSRVQEGDGKHLHVVKPNL
jgi:hypothetical protein